MSAEASPETTTAAPRPRWLLRLAGGAAILLLLVALDRFLSADGLFGYGVSAYTSRLLMLAGINVSLAVSLNLVLGMTGQFSIGHAGFMAVGAYVAAYLSVYHGAAMERAMAFLGPGMAPQGAFLLIVVAAALAAALVGLLVGIPSLRLRGDYLAIVTLGFAEIIRIVLVNLDVVGGATGFAVPARASFLWIGGLAFVTVVAVRNLGSSAVGRTLAAIREDEIAAQAMGVHITRFKVLAFALSAAFAGASGALFGHYTQFLSTNDFTFIRSFEIIVMVIIGGVGSLTGSVLGAFLVTLLPELLRGFASWRLVLYSALLVTIMLTRPQGILGRRELSDLWRGWRRRRSAGEP